jgi:hypothetical protein
MPRKSLRLQIAQEAVIQILSAYLPPLHFHHLPKAATSLESALTVEGIPCKVCNTSRCQSLIYNHTGTITPLPLPTATYESLAQDRREAQ